MIVISEIMDSYILKGQSIRLLRGVEQKRDSPPSCYGVGEKYKGQSIRLRGWNKIMDSPSGCYGVGENCKGQSIMLLRGGVGVN